MNDTPETDNIARGNHVVPTEFAQDLERRLSSARAMVHKLRCERAVARQFGERMERERNESLYDATQETLKVSALKSQWIAVCQERDQWRECAERLADGLLRWLPRYGTGMCNDGAEAMAALAEFERLKEASK